MARPAEYESPEAMQEAITDYIQTNPGKLTITGLAYHLGFESRQSFYDYEKRELFSYTIKRARLFIENEYEKLLISNNTTGAIFALKNFGWTDKQEHELSGGVTVNNVTVKVKRPPDGT